MEVLRGKPSPEILCPPQDNKEGKRQVYRQVCWLKSESQGLVSEYLSHQGPPFSRPGFNSNTPVDGLPTPDDLPASLCMRLPLCLSAFTSLAGWFASVLAWQQELNPRARSLHRRLETCEQQVRALCFSLSAVLGRPEPVFPGAPDVPRILGRKVAGYVACLSYVNWLNQAERDLWMFSAETAV